MSSAAFLSEDMQEFVDSKDPTFFDESSIPDAASWLVHPQIVVLYGAGVFHLLRVLFLCGILAVATFYTFRFIRYRHHLPNRAHISKEELANIHERLYDAIDQRELLQTQIDNIQRKLADSRQELAVLRSELRGAKEREKAALARNQGLVAECEELRKALQHEKNERWKHLSQFEDLRATANTRDKQHEAAFKECDRLRAQVVEMGRKLEVAEARIGRYKQTIEQRKREDEDEHRKTKMGGGERKQDAWRRATAAEERRCRDRDESWTKVIWTDYRALERFHQVLAEFSKAEFKYSETRPLTLLTVPWPVLLNPLNLRLEQIDWAAVEAFFKAAQRGMDPGAYRRLLTSMQRTFHPDRWSAAKSSIIDEILRVAMVKTVTVVSQAINSLI